MLTRLVQDVGELQLTLIPTGEVTGQVTELDMAQWKETSLSIPENDSPLNAVTKSLRATLSDEIFYWGFCFLNREFC
jgi:hypothetical protein